MQIPQATPDYLPASRTGFLRALFFSMAMLLPGTGLPAAASVAPQSVQLASKDGTTIDARLFLPDRDDRPHGVVIALHGCGGLHARKGKRAGQLSARHQAMAELLQAEGYAVLFPDSFGPRGETSLCGQKIGTRNITQKQRRADVLGALDWVAQQPWADARRIALLGWSHGGSAVLAATDATRRDVRQQAVRPALAVAFYPGCSDALRHGYRPTAPLVLMLGALDDWTPPQPCMQLGESVGAQVHVYPDSYHGFDTPSGTVKLRADVPNGVRPGQGVHAGPNPVARAQAYARLRALLRERIGTPTR